VSVRAKVSVEFGVIGACTALFLLLFPRRNPLLDVVLAGLALLGIALSSNYTRNVVWKASPPQEAQNRFKRCLRVTLWVTVPVALLFLATGGFLSYLHGGWTGVGSRILNWRILAAFGCYLPWALMQQTLLQFYLLGRLLVLLPAQMRFLAFIVTGVCFGLVHLPDVWTALVTVAAGMVWSLIYYRYRLILPIAFSHAVLGSAFYYGLFGHDLAAEWRSAG
jgi:membrane protease YdiL (CAAX protease family)